MPTRSGSTRLASGFVHDGSSGGSFQANVAFFASSAWKTGKTCLGLLLGDREEAQIRLRVGDHEQLGEPVGVVAGVVGEDVRRQRVLGLGARLLTKIVLERARQLATHGAQGIEPGPRKTGLTDTNASATLPPTVPTGGHPGS